MTRTRFAVPLLLLSLVLALAACAGRPTAGPDAIPTPVAVTIEDMPNARQIGSDLVFGGQPSEEALRHLVERGYRTIVSTRGLGELDWDERAMVEAAGLTFLEIPMAKPVEGIDDVWIDRFAKVMDEASRPLAVHCSSGNRVAALWTVWLVERLGMTPKDALELGVAAGLTRSQPVVEERLGLCRSPDRE